MRLVVVIGAALLVALAVGWFASEQHYDNCVHAAEARHPIVTVEEPNPFDPSVSSKAVRGERERRAAVDGCSRLP